MIVLSAFAVQDFRVMSNLLRFALGVVGGAVLLASALLLCGCSTATGGGEASTPHYVPPTGASQSAGADSLAYSSPDIIRVGDKLTIRLTDIPNPPDPIDVRVREDGTISLILGVQIQAAGKKAGELETEIHQQYVPKYFQRLTVNVKCEERVFYVDGEVRKPDRYIYTGEMTVLKAISTAGGFTEFAKKNRVEVTRANGGKPLVVDCVKALRNPKLDIPIYPGDRIFVHKRIWL